MQDLGETEPEANVRTRTSTKKLFALLVQHHPNGPEYEPFEPEIEVEQEAEPAIPEKVSFQELMKTWVERQKMIPLPVPKEPTFCAQPEPYFQTAHIQRIVAKRYGVAWKIMFSQTRKMQYVLPRQVAMYLTYTMLVRSLPEVGRRFGGRDHTTVLHSVRKIKRMIESEPAFAATINGLMGELEALRA